MSREAGRSRESVRRGSCACARVTLLLVACALATPRATAAQNDGTTIRWWHPLAVSAAGAFLVATDRATRDFVQDHRSPALDEVADIASHFHESNVVLVAGVGGMSLGLLTRRFRVAETGLQVMTSYGLASGMMIATKWAVGRSRPLTTPHDNTDMHWFGGGEESSFPSGAAAVSFSLATTLADAVDHPVASVLFYGGATLNAWSRVNSDRHWLSDVAVGAVYGITAAKLVNGRWRVFGLRPPTMGIAPDGRLIVGYELLR